MKTRALVFLITLVLLTFKATAALPGFNIISNGDFETLGNFDFPPWQFQTGAGMYAIIDEPARVASGGNCIFVIGHARQTLSTEIGQSYQLSFYERSDMAGGRERDSVLDVFWGGQELGSYYERVTNQPAWNYHTFTVVANSTVTTLDFEQTSGNFGVYGNPGLDCVTVITIPEPSTVCFVGIVVAVSFGNRLRIWIRKV